MLPEFLAVDEIRRGDGVSRPTAVPASGTLAVVVGVTRISEMQSLTVTIQGSPDGKHWDPQPLLQFPRKFYCGTYSLELDLERYPWAGYVRAAWKIDRWDACADERALSFYVFAEKVREPAEMLAAVG